MKQLYIGLMSGTSMDGVDGVVVDFGQQKPKFSDVYSKEFAPELRAKIFALNTPGDNELHHAALAANALAHCYAKVVHGLLKAGGLDASQIVAVGAHGQTVRHQPRPQGAVSADSLAQCTGVQDVGYTIQLNNPALLAELTGIDVVADFRSRDVAAGGQGAPLAPFFHRAWFAPVGSGHTVGVLNIGGISNLSILQPDGGTLGFDCGPGNALLDMWCQQHTGAAFDAGGAWGAAGVVNSELLQSMRAEPYFALPAPKSTGRDMFNRIWLERHLAGFKTESAHNVQKTLLELTAQTISQSVRSCADASGHSLHELIVCGGGAFNTDLMQRLQALMPHTAVISSAERGLPPQDVEAAAFAWLAQQTIERRALPLSSVTGARGNRVLGCIYPA